VREGENERLDWIPAVLLVKIEKRANFTPTKTVTCASDNPKIQ